ncbi:hypothetical protein ma140 [Moumouvirus australiensis]|uniref:DUF5866 domain-containing protein n=1 Tax=Moumouvirus australiensis TaxID=2109587 RepID=A0A2P1EKW4_9VIRU|nr:hypothetical protein QKC55_gp764 [Moumouvirus australiensis]AVL94526.1 hypothetical protein ma140 [Moumouvirus australiensis]
MLHIKSVDGLILTFPENILRDNMYVKGTLIDKVFFGNFKKETELLLNYDKKVVKFLISYIRSGIIYFPKLSKPENGLFDIKLGCKIFWNELIDMLNYIACENNNLLLISEILQKGAMDLFGRKISMADQNFISVNDLFYIKPYDNDLSEKTMENFINGILNSGGCDIKRVLDRKYCANKYSDHKKIIMGVLNVVRNHYYDPFKILTNEYFTDLCIESIFSDNEEQYVAYIIKKYVSHYT